MPVSQKAARKVMFGPEARTPWQIEKLIRQKEDQEKLMRNLRQKRKKEAKDMPLKKEEVSAAKKVAKEPVKAEKPHVEAKGPPPEEIIKKAADSLPAKAVEITVPVGFMVMVRDGADNGMRVLDWLGKRMDMVKDEVSRKEIRIEMKDVAEQFQVPLEQLLEVKGVAVHVPGTDYAIAKTSTAAPSRDYGVAEELFTVDGITLEKTAEDKFEIHVPADAKKDLKNRVLCLTGKKGADGKTITQKLEEGEVRALAMVLAEWARYSACGFSFDEDTEEKVVSAVIRVVGVGIRSRPVGVIDEVLEDEQPMAVMLETEIRKIIGEDQQAWDKIMGFMYPRSPERVSPKLDLDTN